MAPKLKRNEIRHPIYLILSLVLGVIVVIALQLTLI